MTRLLTRLGFRPYPAPPPARSGRCFDLADGPTHLPATLGMYQAASAVLLVLATARPVPEVADVRADD